MTFIKYQHIQHFGADETEGLTDGVCYIFPKMETSKIFKVLIRVLWLVPGFIALGNTPDLVWTVVDIASGLWCVPNAIALIALSGVFMKIYHDYNDKYILKTRPISEPLPYIGKD